MATTYPDATTTGVPSDVTLKQSGSLVITTPGAVIEGLDIRGSVVIDAPNVTLKNCKISDGGYNVVLIKPGVTGTVVQNCDIDNQGAGGQGIAGQGTFVSNNIHGCADGIDVRGDNTVIRDNFIHDMQGTSGSHYDSIQADGNFSNLTISHNTIINEHGQTSAVMLDNYWGPIDNVKIDDNLLVGGGYTVYLNEVADGQAGGGPVTNVSLTNNHIVPGYYGDINLRTELGHDPVISGNTNDGDALLASLQMTGQPSSSDAGTGVSDPAPSTPHDSGTDSHDSGPVASGDQGPASGGSDGASADPGPSSDDSSSNAGSGNHPGTGVSDPVPSTPHDSGTDSHDSGSVVSGGQSGGQGSGSGGSDGASADIYPDATTTGVPSDVTLKQSGSLVITTPGAVIEGLDIRGSVVIDAANVTLKNCKISSGDTAVLIKPGVTGAVVQSCNIDSQGSGGPGIAGQGTFVNNNIHGGADGIDVRGDNTVIRDNFIHDVKGASGSSYDGIQADGNFSNLSIVHNTVINEGGQTAIMLDNYWGPIDNVKVDDNLLVGGGYTVYLAEIANGQAGGGPVTNVSFTDNHIVPGYYGDMNVRTELGHDPVISGNTNDGDAILASLQMTGQPSSSAIADAGISDPAPSPSQDSGTDSSNSGPVASDHQGTTLGDSDSVASADPGSTSGKSSVDAGSSGDLETPPADQGTSTPNSGSHDGHHHWRKAKDGAGADTKSATSNVKADGESSHATSKHSVSSQDKMGSEHTNASAGEPNAGQKHAGISQKASDGSHGSGHDSFVFGSNFQDMVEKLQQRASHHDFGQSKSIYDHFADALNLASKAGHDGIHAGASGDTLTFKDAKASNHHHNDFHFS